MLAIWFRPWQSSRLWHSQECYIVPSPWPLALPCSVLGNRLESSGNIRYLKVSPRVLL
jgi:hypothetical protein